MDYQFRVEQALPVARLSMEHEALGRWLTEELGSDEVKLVQVLRAVREAGENHIDSQRFSGREMSLVIEGDEVRVEPHGRANGEEADLLSTRYMEDDAIDTVEGLAPAQCGLQDFETLLQAWHSFVK